MYKCGRRAHTRYTYPTVEYLNNLDVDGLTVLGYGSGNSSRYYLRRDAKVIAIENDREWYERIRSECSGEELEYVFCDSIHDYVHRGEIKFADIVIIDGSHRPECADYVIKSINEGLTDPAIIIFDNSDWFPSALGKIDEEIGWVRVDFCGFGPINRYTWVTSLFLTHKKCCRASVVSSNLWRASLVRQRFDL